MKELFQKLIYKGISKDTGLRESEQIRIQNLFNLVFIFILLVSGITSIILKEEKLALIEAITAVLFISVYLIFPPYKQMKIWSLLAISIVAINAVIAYFLSLDNSFVILLYIVMMPIGTVALFGPKGAWGSSILIIIVVLGNLFPIIPGFVPIETIALFMFCVAYIVMIVASSLVFITLERRISDQLKKVEYYEKEIGERDAFTAKLSHKLRTSLSNITLINNLVHDSRMSTAQKELLDTLKMSTIDLISNVNELVEIATPTIIDYRQSILSFNLEEALNGTIDILETDKISNRIIEVIGTKNIDYHVIGDPSLLRSVLINLTKGIFSIDMHAEKFAIQVSIDYETPNMYGLKFTLHFISKDSSSIENVVSLMKKGVDTYSSNFNIANRLLSLTSSKPEFDDQGIVFFLDFAKDLTRKIVESQAEEKIKKGTKEKSLLQSTLLLVEDNAINQKIVLLSLNKLVKKIDVANNGKEALDMFGTKKYDAILMDIQMPVMDGITATKKIREIETTSEERIPILAITANALSGDRDNCLAAGADEYLSKPFQVEDLVVKISALLAS
ncbi:MAG: response regulator [Bacteroidales bacterium]|jgi:CheY-like chemotaxis protein/signal transduction histidine kinase|nr:response regulator [Bacteroidales bacterium]